MDKLETLKELYLKMCGIADQAIDLADQYAGGESETANELSTMFDEIESEFSELFN